MPSWRYVPGVGHRLVEDAAEYRGRARAKSRSAPSADDNRWVPPAPDPRILKPGNPPYGETVWLQEKFRHLPHNLKGTVPEESKYKDFAKVQGTKIDDCLVYFRGELYEVPFGILRKD